MKYDNYTRLEVLTPVHIGNGDTSDPLDYVITSKNGSDYLCQIDLDSWLEDYPDQQELAKVLDGGRLPVIRKFIADNLDTDIYARSRATIISPEISRKYKQHIANLNSPNQLLIDPALKNPLTGCLLVPGSSIKGAMRTAVIDWCDQNWNLNLRNSRNPREYTQNLERALGSIRESTFKQLKTGDFEAVINASAIVTAKEKSIKVEKINGTPKNSCEVCLSAATEGEPQPLFGRFAIGEQSNKQDTFLTCKMEGKVQRWSLSELLKLVTDFYRQRYEAEKQKFYTQPHFSQSSDVITMLDSEFASLDENQMILRVGHYSHIECMTVSNNKPVGKKGYGKTRTLADNTYPFGWVKLTLCGQEEHDTYWQQKQQLERQVAAERQQLRQTKIEQRQQQLQQQLEQQRQQEQAEQSRLAQIADEKANPWKKLVKQIDQIDNWGEFKQKILENGELSSFAHIAEFSSAVYRQALVVQKKAAKWDESRNQLLVEWFEATDQTWITATEEDSSITLSPEIEQINNLNQWGDYNTSGIKIDTLSPDALIALQNRFKEWDCDKKKAKKPKQKAWKEVCQRMKST
ncbi:MAG: type III-A CRISPR-associated RAMP protein Csm5 [Deltaproteobacteria bacterium]|nr:MAG: type III-A CRISPR-associated RAMP protein Csm5 [Deltaproteobacteria bacterium]